MQHVTDTHGSSSLYSVRRFHRAKSQLWCGGLPPVETSGTSEHRARVGLPLQRRLLLRSDTGVCSRSLLQHLGFEDMLPAVEPEPEAPAAESTAEDLDAAAAHLGMPPVVSANIPSLVDPLPRCLRLDAARMFVPDGDSSVNACINGVNTTEKFQLPARVAEHSNQADSMHWSAGELSADTQHGAGGDGGYPQPQAPQPGRPMDVRSTLSGDGVDYFNTLSVEGTARNLKKITGLLGLKRNLRFELGLIKPVSSLKRKLS